jgi:hypothetical protein
MCMRKERKVDRCSAGVLCDTNEAGELVDGGA